MYDKILLPTDGSEKMAKVIDNAVNLAEKYNSILHTLFVVDTRYADLLTGERGLEASEKMGKKAIKEVENEAKKKTIEITKNIVKGIPAQEIIKYADENKIDLIVIGTHGKTGLNEYLLGSVAERVLRHSNVPILLTR
ncbi:MAG: Nucleotide-binding protein UspA family [Candidatus Methanohalarchaeum thermophilum]|uniref:Nucleotide-binding protein UspA family n=1 Tax=Methanohalarchaeum thermophilum TaxID=1903181 RepID=A0A1Q6DXV4_METT1|nr:MAG: Nucleotide-binding protein UspA family [Candidatus Methanohalarchaeum thermophilum]